MIPFQTPLLEVYVDASFRKGWKGLAVIGFENGMEVFRRFKKSKAHSSTLCESEALNLALKTLIRLQKNEEPVIVYFDWLHVLGDPEYIAYFKDIRFQWIPRQLNWKADRLSQEAIL